ncbi:MAG TPA: hypothetical protein VKM93_19105, partial [Terriglobia bacterium]|nr:hypothetical protein [Terriglobia bacterium]
GQCAGNGDVKISPTRAAVHIGPPRTTIYDGPRDPKESLSASIAVFGVVVSFDKRRESTDYADFSDLEKSDRPRTRRYHKTNEATICWLLFVEPFFS